MVNRDQQLAIANGLVDVFYARAELEATVKIDDALRSSTNKLLEGVEASHITDIDRAQIVRLVRSELETRTDTRTVGQTTMGNIRFYVPPRQSPLMPQGLINRGYTGGNDGA